MSKYVRKTRDVYAVQGFYNGEWETVTHCATWGEARADRTAYRLNEGGEFRIKIIREKIVNE